MDLEKNLIDNILECELKLGYANTPICFYYPITSLMELLECEEPEIASAIQQFLERELTCLGKVIVKEQPNEKGRYAVTIPVEGIRWVSDHFQPTDFMRLLISEINRPGNTLEDIVKIFTHFSSEVDVKKVSDKEWVIGFADESIDPYVYHIEQNEFGFEYHRFTREAYEKTMGEPRIMK